MIKYQLSHQKNIRDLGGLTSYNNLKIKHGRLYRGGVLSKTNEDDLDILNSFHLTDIIDFRGPDEFRFNKDVVLDGVTYHNFPAIEEKVKLDDRKNDDGNLLWFLKEGLSGYEHLKEQYKELVNTKKSQEAYKEFFKVLLNDNRVIYYHCSQGKDRAGLASFYIETALGVDQETIIDDYLESNVAMNEKIGRLIKSVEDKPYYDEKYKQSLLDVFSAKLDYINAAIEEMIKISGSPLKYIEEILEVDIKRLREIYLER